jgi:hypothetical protein
VIAARIAAASVSIPLDDRLAKDALCKERVVDEALTGRRLRAR